MQLHWFQHVPFEDLGAIATWSRCRGFDVSCTRLYAGEPLPSIEAIEWLIVMGGPMGVTDSNRYAWLPREQDFIADALQRKCVVLGFCLGAQLMAASLGARVTRNAHREIGWFPVDVQPNGHLGSMLPPTVMAFHWHGDTFAVPDGGQLEASSPACDHQAFSYGDRAFGFQFHLEATPGSVRRLIRHCPDDLAPGPYVQTASAMAWHAWRRSRKANRLLRRMLDGVAERT